MNEMLELLRDIEWAKTDSLERDRCPYCNSLFPKHRSDCKLNAVIKRLECFTNELKTLRNAPSTPI